MKALQVADSQTALTTQQAITGDLFSRFIAYLDAKPKTVETYTRAIRQLQKYFSLKGIIRPTRADILAFRDELRTTRKPTTVQNYITATRLFFKWLEQEHIYPNIADHLKGAKLDKDHKKDYLTSRQVKAVLGCINRSADQGARDYAIIVLMITGGLRTIEISRADVGDLRNLGDMTVLYIQGKGRDEKTEYVKIPPPIEAAIRDYLKTRNAADPDAPLFVSTSNNSNGGRLSTRSISGIVKSRLKDAGYNSDKLTAHSLRHTAVTLSLLAGKDLAEVQQFARHSNIATTQIYNHALEKAKNGCSEAITNAIF